MKEGFLYTAISLVKYNNLYYIDEPVISAIYSTALKNSMAVDSVYGTSSVALYDLWHYCLGHSGHQTMKIFHKHANGVHVLNQKSIF